MANEDTYQSALSYVQRPDLSAALQAGQPLYVLPKDDVIAEVLIPALNVASSLDVMMGYFTSSSLAEIAPGLATFLRNTEAPMRMVVSPFLATEDFEALTQDEGRLTDLARKMLIDDIPDEDDLVHHTLACLAWLITQERLLMKVALMRGALFHPKVWLFHDGVNRAALHGSTNLTKTGLCRNREQLTLSREWSGEEATFHVDRLRREFDDLWCGGDKDCYVLPLPAAVARNVIERHKTNDLPDEKKLRALWENAQGLNLPVPTDLSKPTKLAIPSYLIYESGAFAHQGTAVKAWDDAGRRGILEMATGSGKTITSMICATRLQDDIGPLLVVVSAPYRPLVAQWCEEISEFGVNPINLTTIGGPKARDREIRQAGRRLRMGLSKAEVLVVSNVTLCTASFDRSLSVIKYPKLLIADECHNLGVESFIGDPPDYFDYRLALSATPVRQFDEDGTESLIKYFGNICFSFTLDQAIGKCLTEYDYHVHFIELSTDEMLEWTNLTNKIASLSWKLESEPDDSYLKSLFRQRRLILETARDKLGVLEKLLDSEGARKLRYTLIYATDKDPEHLDKVNELLGSRGVLFHQLTEEETQSRKKTQRILTGFQTGLTQVLTAKRVLDEGVNIPQIKLAFLLASTTVQRQWIQRRGRLLRKCKAIGKTHAVIHDFVVLPPNASSRTAERLDPDVRRLVRSELNRVWEFAHLSRNAALPGGPYEAVQHMQSLANELLKD